MYCMQCGKETENNSICSHCGAVQHENDPFCTLGDLESVASDRIMTVPVSKSNMVITKKDFFGVLGDISPSNDDSNSDTTDKIINKDSISTDPFREMENLDGSPIIVNSTVVDTPATGGFKPLYDLDSEGGASDKNQTDDKVSRKKKVEFVWKRWMSAVACCAVLTVLFIVILTNITSGKSNIYETAIEKKINGAVIQGVDLPLSYQYNNAVLKAIEFEVLEVDKRFNSAIVNFSYVDVLALADTYTESLNDADAFYQYCIDRITNGTAPMLSKTISVSYIVTEYEEIAQCIAIDSLDLADVMTGGVASEYIKLTGVDKE